MTSLKQRKPASIILLLLAAYLTAFLIHDLTHCQFSPGSSPGSGPYMPHGTLFNGDPAGSDILTLSAPVRHHCPFCNGFTGSIIISPLSPPATACLRAALPLANPDHGLPWPSSIARAPPVA